MWAGAVQYFRCPSCRGGGGVTLEAAILEGPAGQIKEGRLACPACRRSYEIRNYIHHFVTGESYASSFGFEWNVHARTQLDKFSGRPITRDRFRETTRWPENLNGQRVLEAGCGAGRFSEVVLDAGAELFSFDLSSAVDANLANNGMRENFTLFQASVYDVPLEEETFDKVFCLGVLQHTPDVKGAFLNLVRFVKPGGQIAVDVYRRTRRTPFIPKYLLRPLTKRLPKSMLYRACRLLVPVLSPLRAAVYRIPVIGYYLHLLLPIACYRESLSSLAERLTREQIREWEILDTFDMYSPEYDNPQMLEAVRAWCEEAGLCDIFVRPGPNGINATATRPPHAATC